MITANLITIKDPIKTPTVWGLVGNALDLVIPLSAILFVVMIIYGGISYILNQTDTDKVKGAQTIIKNAIIGLVVVASAFVALSLVQKALNV